MANRRVAVTGVGILSSLGGSYPEVVESLRRGRSGLVAVPEWAELGLASAVAGRVEPGERLREGSGLSDEQLLGMSEAALYCTVAGRDAVADAGLTPADLARRSTGCVVGSGISGTLTVARGAQQLEARRPRRISPFAVLQAMASSCSANLASVLQVGGRSYSLSAACATSAHAIGHAYELIREGRLTVALAGGGEELNPIVAAAFNAMRTALSTRYNQTPERASRPFDRRRDGFVLAEGAGVVVLEEWERACARGARIRAELVGYAANTDTHGMVLPSPDGGPEAECMADALADAGLEPRQVDYVNAHATGTLLGDRAEGQALERVFGAAQPLVSATKSTSGHSLGAAGAHELIFCLGMLEHNFVAPSANVEDLDPAFADLKVVTRPEERRLDVVLSSSFGFGGANAVLVLRRAPEP